MSHNARLDREEIDLLWWVITDWSQLVDQRVSRASPAVSCLVSGLEASGVLVEPAARAHRDIALRNLNGFGETRTAVQLADESVEVRGAARAVAKRALPAITGSPTVLPTLAIATLEPDAPAGTVPPGIDGGKSMTIGDWCRRAVEEASLLARLGHPVDLSQPTP